MTAVLSEDPPLKTAYVATPLVLLLSMFVRADEGLALPEFGLTEAGELYETSCSDCHLAPAPSRKTDLARVVFALPDMPFDTKGRTVLRLRCVH